MEPASRPAKVVYSIAWKTTDARPDDEGGLSEILAANAALHDALRKHKESISESALADWDRYKKLCNEYESVFTSSGDLSSSTPYVPTSRSFFKLWEMLSDFPELTAAGAEGRPMQAAFLAEGPGGFVEAFCRYRRNNPGDRLHGMTLHTGDRRVPSWRLPRDVPMQVCVGADGSGDLYDPRNVEALVRQAGASSCDLVTADGGFDFSHDFNGQESASLPLLWAETQAALRLQKPGGCFVLKVYDVSCANTMCVLQFLAERYDRLHVTKPLTSRPANSEKYVVCCGYRGSDSDSGAPALATPMGRAVLRMNAFFVTRQIIYIIKTKFCIAHADAELVKALSHAHGMLSKEWCRAYGLGT